MLMQQPPGLSDFDKSNQNLIALNGVLSQTLSENLSYPECNAYFFHYYPNLLDITFLEDEEDVKDLSV